MDMVGHGHGRTTERLWPILVQLRLDWGGVLVIGGFLTGS